MTEARGPHSQSAAYEPAFAEDAPTELRERLLRIWGYKWLLLALIAIVMGPAWVMVEQMPKRYTARALLLIKPPQKNVIEIKDVVEGLDRRRDTLKSELAVLTSREIATKAVEKLDLFDSTAFPRRPPSKSLFSHINPLQYLPKDWSSDVVAFWRDAKASVIERQPTVVLSEEEKRERQRKATVSRFLSGVSVQNELGTRLIRISFTFHDPKFAAKAANALADVYVRNTLDVKYAGTKEAATWLSEQLEILRKKVEESEAAAEKIRQGEVLVQGRSAQLISQRISSLSTHQLDARSEVARLSARLAQIDKMKKSPDWEDQSSVLLGSDLIQSLRLEQYKLQRKAAELSTEYGEKHPTMINARVEIANVDARIRREIEKIIASIRAQLSAARTRVASIGANLRSLTNSVGDASQAERRLKSLEREAAANRSLYQTFLTRFKETSVQEEVQQPDARVISYAEVPGGPSYPPKRKILLQVFAAALGIGLVLIYLIEAIDKGFRTARQLEQQTGLKVLGFIPKVSLRRSRHRYPEDYIVDEPYSRYAESINLLYYNTLLSSADKAAHTVLFCSALPKEGKTATTISFARRAASVGDKVLVLDCDFRRPQASRQLGLRLYPGISEIMAGKATFEEAIQQDPFSEVKFLSSGRATNDPAGTLKSEWFQDFLEVLKQEFDLIILDSPPVLAVVEPQILARLATRTVVLVRWGKTPRQAAMSAIKQLQDYGADISGVALTQVNPSKQRYYGYGEYGYYTNAMKGYYSR